MTLPAWLVGALPVPETGLPVEAGLASGLLIAGSVFLLGALMGTSQDTSSN